jgi:hypothetical protein
LKKAHTIFHRIRLEGFKQVIDEKQSLNETHSRELNGEARFNVDDHPREVTGLGIIASIIVPSWFLVRGGTLRFSSFLIITAVLPVSAGGLIYRLLPENSGRRTGSQNPGPGRFHSGLIR